MALHCLASCQYAQISSCTLSTNVVASLVFALFFKYHYQSFQSSSEVKMIISLGKFLSTWNESFTLSRDSPYFFVKVITHSLQIFLVTLYICDRLWEKVCCRAYFQNRVIGTPGLSKLSAIKCTTRFVVKVTFCGVMVVSVQ